MLGKPLIKPFPSTLPPQTVLDCILDDNWYDNGIIHVLDVISWKGQDLGDCEAPFRYITNFSSSRTSSHSRPNRFWWRDTRLSELNSFPPPPSAVDPSLPSTSRSVNAPHQSQSAQYKFPYPTTFSPIPYHTNTTLVNIVSTLIPLTRTARTISFTRPIMDESDASTAMSMDLDISPTPVVQLQKAHAQIASDGLLLYLAQASYEPGTSPLSTWVPLRAYQTREEQNNGLSPAESPLDVFDR